ncbi:MAG: Rne/Rng family ribonuclease [Pseudomonadota bacterium]
MTKLMLIDASDPAETRVVVTRDDRVDEFDREIGSHAQIKGNIYLAKVTRVEPSLQAAFVDYGGNRHGFLPFSEIHPDYYRIPIADREALLAEEAAIKALAEAEEDDEDEEEEPAPKPKSSRRRSSRRSRSAQSDEPDTSAEEAPEAAQEEAEAPVSADAQDAAGEVQEGDAGQEEAVQAAEPESETGEIAQDAAPDSGGEEQVAETADAEKTPAKDPQPEETEESREPAAAAAEEAPEEAPEIEAQDEQPAGESDTETSDQPAEGNADEEEKPGRAQPMTAKSGDQISATPEEAAEAASDPQNDAPPKPAVDAGEQQADAAADGDAKSAEAVAQDPLEAEPQEGEAAPEPDAEMETASAETATQEAKTAALDPVAETAEAVGESDEGDAEAETEEQAAESETSGSSRRSRSRRSSRRSSRSRRGGDEEPQAEASEESEEEGDKGKRDVVEEVEQETEVDTLDGDDIEDAARRRAKLLRRYKIQEVIKRGQIMLVQASKEERGNKGAALTTYLSLPGRYCVLMPNTARGGGISRKIASSADRKRLKQVLNELEIPDGMAVIVRTAGSERSRTEIRRDYDYLIRLWGEIREGTLQAQAPALIYEEGSIIKRAIRDLYTSDMAAILVEGEEGYKAAKAFMRNLMPSHARKVQLHKSDGLPLLQEHRVEQQLASMFQPDVQLRSGGYLVINVTEALVAIDVNSGKATRERHIEETALKTNLEAATEVARQLRLRDLAGLIVIDFIDMEENRHNREVERRLKEAMKADRARIQLGRISPFGLLELSRQRLRPSLVETSMVTCPHCGGTGKIYSPETSAMALLRAIAEEGGRRTGGELVVTVPSGVALYLLNEKRAQLSQDEERFDFALRVEVDESLSGLQHRIERIGGTRRPPAPRPQIARSAPDAERDSDEELREEARDEPAERDDDRQQRAGSEQRDEEQDENGGKRRRRRGKRGGRRRSRRGDEGQEAQGQDAESQDVESQEADAEEAQVQEGQALAGEAEEPQGKEAQTEAPQTEAAQTEVPQAPTDSDGEADTRSALPADEGEAGEGARGQEEGAVAAEQAAEDPTLSNGTAPGLAEPAAIEPLPEPAHNGDGEPASEDASEPEPPKPNFDVVTAPDPERPKRRGWWNRLVR